VAGAVVWVACLVDVLQQPHAGFEAIGTTKAGWVIRLALFGWIAGLVYLVSVRPRLRAAVRSGLPAAAAIERVPRRKQDWGDPFAPSDARGAPPRDDR